MVYSKKVVDQIEQQDLRAAVKEYFYEKIGVKKGIYPTKDEIYNFMLLAHMSKIPNI